MDILTQVGVSLPTIILASNTLTGLFKFLIPETNKFYSQYVRLMNFAFSLSIAFALVIVMGIENTEVITIIIALIGSIGAESVHNSNSDTVIEVYEDGEDM